MSKNPPISRLDFDIITLYLYVAGAGRSYVAGAGRSHVAGAGRSHANGRGASAGARGSDAPAGATLRGGRGVERRAASIGNEMLVLFSRRT